MSINQTELYDALQGLTQREDVRAEFIYAFLNAYGFAKSTITQLRNGGARNVAKIAGDVALKGQLYFHPAQTGENLHEVAERLRDGDAIKTQKIRFVIATNFEEVVAYDLKADERMETSFTELHQQYSFFLPMAGLEKSYTHSESVADVKAAEKMGRLFDLIRERNQIATAEEVHALNVFLTRLLFCFFAEDTGIFEKHQFTDAIKSTTREDGEDVAEFLRKFFSVLNSPGDSALRQSMPAHLKVFPYVNGGLFEQQLAIPAFGAKSRRLLLECGTLDWSQINPDIFGSMFQAVIDEEQRSTMGQHYTDVSNIMKVIKPLFLDKLYGELERSCGNEKRLQALLERISRIKVFDPACGSGNFLIIAYKELRRLEMEVFRALNAVSKQNVIFMTGIKLSQFYGIEIDDFAHEIALLSLWLAEHQMHQEFEAAFGYVQPMLPLKASGNILCGNSLREHWNRVCPHAFEDEVYVIGNPPFVGKKEQSDEQKAEVMAVFGNLKGAGILDYVCCWYRKTVEYMGDNPLIRAAFVSTNSITQGEQVGVLWSDFLARGVKIHFAHRTFQWTSAARGKAAVHCVIVGFGLGAVSEKLIYDYETPKSEAYIRRVNHINPYLVDAPDIVVQSRSTPLCNIFGMIKGNEATDDGHLILNRYEMESVVHNDPGAEQWIRPLIGGNDFLNGGMRWCLWLDGITPAQLQAMPEVLRRVERVRDFRLKSPKKASRDRAATPWLSGENRQPKSGRFILVPKVSSERRLYAPIDFLDSKTIVNNTVQLVPEADQYQFGILQSVMHMAWLRAVGGRMKSDYQYSIKLVYNTFPWPEVTEAQRKQIDVLSEGVLLARENYPDKSLADLYDPNRTPSDLKAAHNALDEAVDRLYRSRAFRDDSERLEHLFARYETLIRNDRLQKEAEVAAKKVRKPKVSKTSANA